MNARIAAYLLIAGALVAVGALAVVGAQWHLRGRQIAHLQRQAATLSADLAQAKSERDACTADIETQNTAVAALRAAGEAQAARVAQAEQAAAQAGRVAQARVQAVLAAKVPTECPAAMRWLGDEGRALARDWSAAP